MLMLKRNKMPALDGEAARRLKLLLKHSFVNIYKVIHQIDPTQAETFKAKNSQSTPSRAHSCCENFCQFYFPECSMSPLERALHQLLGRFGEMVPEILETLSAKFDSIKDKGMKDKLGWDRQTESYVLQQTLIEGVNQHVSMALRKMLQKQSATASKQPMLQAFPNTWEHMYPEVPLEFLSSSFLSDLHKEGLGTMSAYAGEEGWVQSLQKQLQFLEKDGRFELSNDRLKGPYKKTLWLGRSELNNTSEFKAMQKLVTQLSSIPFELTKKTRLQVLISERVMFAVQQPHLEPICESGRQADSGKKYSFLYSLAPTALQLDGRGGRTGRKLVSVQRGQLLGWESRNFEFRVLSPESCLVVRFWVDGPVQQSR